MSNPFERQVRAPLDTDESEVAQLYSTENAPTSVGRAACWSGGTSDAGDPRRHGGRGATPPPAQSTVARGCSGSKGRSPSPAPLYPQGVGWLTYISPVRQALGRGCRDPATTAIAAVPRHLYERFGEPVQTHLAKRGLRWDRDRRCRAVHALRKLERRTISPAPMSLGAGTGSALGWITLTTFDSSGPSTRSLGLSFTLRQPEGRHPTSSIWHGFQSSLGAEGRPRPMSRASGGRTVRMARIGSFTANAVEDGAEVSIGDVQTRAANRCFGVSMLGR